MNQNDVWGWLGIFYCQAWGFIHTEWLRWRAAPFILDGHCDGQNGLQIHFAAKHHGDGALKELNDKKQKKKKNWLNSSLSVHMWSAVLMEFSLYVTVNSGNLKHELGSRILSHICLTGAVVAFSFLTQDVAGSNYFDNKYWGNYVHFNRKQWLCGSRSFEVGYHLGAVAGHFSLVSFSSMLFLPKTLWNNRLCLSIWGSDEIDLSNKRKHLEKRVEMNAHQTTLSY